MPGKRWTGREGWVLGLLLSGLAACALDGPPVQVAPIPESPPAETAEPVVAEAPPARPVLSVARVADRRDIVAEIAEEYAQVACVCPDLACWQAAGLLLRSRMGDAIQHYGPPSAHGQERYGAAMFHASQCLEDILHHHP